VCHYAARYQKLFWRQAAKPSQRRGTQACEKGSKFWRLDAIQLYKEALSPSKFPQLKQITDISVQNEGSISRKKETYAYLLHIHHPFTDLMI
jgi:hypothetical protein